MGGGYPKWLDKNKFFGQTFRIAVSCAMSRSDSQLAGTAAHCSERSEAISLQRFSICDVLRMI